MSELFDTNTLITLAVAIFVLMKLRSVLGQRTGYEHPVDRDELERQRQKNVQERQAQEAIEASPEQDNVVSIKDGKKTKADPKRAKEAADPVIEAINAYAKPNTKLNKGLKSVAQVSSGFEPKNFLEGARMAYEMIVTSFADGDKKALKGLLSKEVYEGFSSAITEREKAGEKMNFSFIGIEKSNIKSANVADNDALVTVQFISQIVSATLDKSDEVIEGDLEQVAEVNDIWTFARDTRSKNPNWKLVATESDS
ncbi:MAG: Tim44/TimA family putative adaptor protein [Nitratireductor sp.]